MKFQQVLFFIISSLLLSHAEKPKHTIFCHWDITSLGRKQTSIFNMYFIDGDLCNNLVIGSAVGLDPKGSGAVAFINEDLHNIQVLLKLSNGLKSGGHNTIITVGEWQNDPKRFSKMVADVRKRDQFFISLTKLLFECELGGVHLDWEYPTQNGGKSKDRENFVTFLKELKIILQEHNLLLMVTVSARMDKVTLASYDIPQIAEHVDYIILNSYDNRDPFTGRLDYISPLYGNGSQSMERGVRHWVRQTKTPEKLLLGIPLFAHTYTLKDPSNTVVGAPSIGPGFPHLNSHRPGFMTSSEFCVQAVKWEKKYDAQAQAPYAYKDDQWITYEDGRSISAKMHLGLEQGLGGAMALSIDSDDFSGQCGYPYSLLRVMISLMGRPEMLTTQAPTTEGVGLCPNEGLFRNLWDCQAYYECRDGRRFDYECLDDESFDEALGQCKPTAEVECNDNFITWRPGQDGYNSHNLPLNLKVVD